MTTTAKSHFDAAHGGIRRRAFGAYKHLTQAVRRLHPGDPSRQTVFVAGIQRSGTNMIMEVLERSMHTTVFHESDPRAFQDYELRELPVLQRLHRNALGETVAFKALCDLHSLPELMEAFAPSRAIWMIRDLDDMVNSHAESRFGKQRLCPQRIQDMAVDKLSAGWRGRGMSDETQEILRRHVHPGINHYTAVALFWYMRNVLFFERGLDKNPDVILVRYEDLVTEPLPQVRRIFGFLGLGGEDFAAARIRATSIRRRPAPEIEAPVRELCADLRQRFEALLPG